MTGTTGTGPDWWRAYSDFLTRRMTENLDIPLLTPESTPIPTDMEAYDPPETGSSDGDRKWLGLRRSAQLYAKRHTG